jgi:hypothetical protein
MRYIATKGTGDTLHKKINKLELLFKISFTCQLPEEEKSRGKKKCKA